MSLSYYRTQVLTIVICLISNFNYSIKLNAVIFILYDLFLGFHEQITWRNYSKYTELIK